MYDKNLEDLETVVTSLLARKLKVDLYDVKRESELVNDLGGDSLSLADVFMCLEERFGVNISHESAERMFNGKVEDVFAVVKNEIAVDF